MFGGAAQTEWPSKISGDGRQTRSRACLSFNQWRACIPRYQPHLPSSHCNKPRRQPQQPWFSHLVETFIFISDCFKLRSYDKRMAPLKHLKLLLTLAPLISCSLATAPSQKILDDDDIDDTPLPVVIWHGELIALFTETICWNYS